MNNAQSLAGANCDEMQTLDFLMILFCRWEKVTGIVQIQETEDGLSQTLVRALPYRTVWVDEPSPFVVSGVATRTRDSGIEGQAPPLFTPQSSKFKIQILQPRQT